jgi:RNA polymerase sporulation-specific sigma factor
LQCREALTLQLGREPSLKEIAAQLELPEKDISAALDAISAPVSLFDPVFTDGGDPLTVMDQVRDTKNTEGSWLEQITLREGFSRLGDREKQILHARFFDGRTQMDVAKSMHISQAQVSRLEKGAICELRKYVSVQVS